MRARTATVVAVVTVLVGGLIGSSAESASGATALISGSGSSAAANAVNQWIADANTLGLQVVYTADGSSAGRKDFADETTDFAVTDVPYQGVDPATQLPDTSNGREYGDVPLVAGGVAFPYHVTVGGVLDRNLRLSGETLMKIFTNQITNWDSPEITADNNGVALPPEQIIPVVHSEESGVTLLFSAYLATEFPSQWHAFFGTNSATPYYPAVGHAVAVNGSDGVMNYVAAHTSEGTIGMDEYGYALGASYPVARVENAAGYFAVPTPDNVAIALRNATIDSDSESPTYMRPDLKGVFESTDPRAYPLSDYSSMLIPTSPTDPKMTTPKRQALADFADYAICEGQREDGGIGDAPLPLNLVEAAMTQIGRLKSADPSVDLTDLDVAHCNNPTFIAAHPNQDHLGKIAPEPFTCDKVGHGPCAAGVTPDPVEFGDIYANRPRIVDGQHVRLGAGFAFADAPGPGTVVELQRRGAPQHWVTLASRKTSASGALSVRLAPTATASYRFRYAGDAATPAMTTPVIRVPVAAALTLHVRHADGTVGHRVSLRGRVVPDESYWLRLQRRVNGHWRSVLTSHRTSARFRIRFLARRGEARYRLLVLATHRNARATSPTFTVLGS